MFTIAFFKKAQFIQIIFTDLGNVLGNGKTEINRSLPHRTQSSGGDTLNKETQCSRINVMISETWGTGSGETKEGFLMSVLRTDR